MPDQLLLKLLKLHHWPAVLAAACCSPVGRSTSRHDATTAGALETATVATPRLLLWLWPAGNSKVRQLGPCCQLVPKPCHMAACMLWITPTEKGRSELELQEQLQQHRIR
jgi:hypothetical protein